MIEDRPENIVEIAKKYQLYVITMYTIKIYLIKMFIDVLVGMIYIIKLIIWILLKINLIKFKICRRKNARIFLQERI